jgi:hypothetical protein
MAQNIISLNFSDADLTTIDEALALLEQKLAPLTGLSPKVRRGLVKMVDKSEAFCRETLMVLAQNPHLLPPSFDLADTQNDLAQIEKLRSRAVRLRRLLEKADDGETALGRRCDERSIGRLCHAQGVRQRRGPGRAQAGHVRPLHPQGQDQGHAHRRLVVDTAQPAWPGPKARGRGSQLRPQGFLPCTQSSKPCAQALEPRAHGSPPGARAAEPRPRSQGACGRSTGLRARINGELPSTLFVLCPARSAV